MTWLPDVVVERLRDVATRPELPSDRYVILRPIGRGGMGTVYAARDEQLGREVAIKVSNAVAPADDLEQRLRQEARVLATLEHPGIVPVHDAGRLDDGRWFYVMKLVRGHTLGEHAAALAHEAARLAIFERVAETVAFAHAAGVVHRDLKPSNVMVGQFGEVLVLDWGMASVLGRAGAPSAGPSADVYALGALLDWMWTQGTAVPPTPPKRLAAIVRKCQSPEPLDRYATATELLEDLARYRQGAAVLAYRETAIERVGRWLVRYQTLVWLVIAYLVMRVAFAFLWR